MKKKKMLGALLILKGFFQFSLEKTWKFDTIPNMHCMIYWNIQLKFLNFFSLKTF